MRLICLSAVLTTIRCCMQTVPDVTTTEKPPLPIPPCAMCPEAGFYNASLCPPTEHDGCMGIAAGDAIMNTTTPQGCLEASVICPADSYVYIVSGMLATGPRPSTEVKDAIDSIYCNNEGTWTIQNQNHAQLDQLVCYRKGCSLCESSIVTNDGCLDKLICTDPVSFTYLGGGLNCKTFAVECNDEQLLFLGLGGDEMPSGVAVERDDIETVIKLSCGSDSQWTVTFLDDSFPPRSVTNIRCANFADDR